MGKQPVGAQDMWELLQYCSGEAPGENLKKVVDEECVELCATQICKQNLSIDSLRLIQRL